MRYMLVATVALAFLCCPPLLAQEYPIKLDRLPKAGSVIEVTSQTEQTGELKTLLSKLLRWGVTGTYRTSGAVVARITIEEVDAAGWATKASLKILRFDTSTGNQKAAIDLKGKVYNLSVHEGRRRYLEPTGDGGSYVLDEPKASMLDLAIPLRFMKGEAGLDAMFGTAEPKKSGATWKGDPQAIAGSFAHWSGMKEKSQGSSTLKKVAGKILTVDSSLAVTGLKITGLTFNLPGDYVPTEVKHEMQLSTTLSTEEDALPSAQTIKVSYNVSGTLNGAKESEWDKGTGQAKYKLVK